MGSSSPSHVQQLDSILNGDSSPGPWRAGEFCSSCDKELTDGQQKKLDKTLKMLGVNELIVTGTVTNICVMIAVGDAGLRGYKVVVPKNAVAGLDKKM